MKKIVLNDITYLIPSSWVEITLEQQMLLSDYEQQFKDETTRKIAVISAYSTIPIDVLKRAKINDLTNVFKEMSFINKDITTETLTEFKFNDETYYVSQNLMNQEFQEYISLQNVQHQYKDNPSQALPMILAIMCKRKKENGLLETMDEYNVEERAEQFKKLNLVIANSIALFFSRSINVLSTLSLQFSNPKEIVKMKMEEVENTLKQQRGQGLLTKCVNGILRISLWFIERQQNKHSIF